MENIKKLEGVEKIESIEDIEEIEEEKVKTKEKEIKFRRSGTCTSGYRKWTAAEEEILKHFIKKRENNKIPYSEINELAKMLKRSTPSLVSKIYRMKIKEENKNTKEEKKALNLGKRIKKVIKLLNIITEEIEEIKNDVIFLESWADDTLLLKTRMKVEVDDNSLVQKIEKIKDI